MLAENSRFYICLQSADMKNILAFVFLVVSSGLLLTNIYNTLVDVKSWGSDIPQSIISAREYFRVVNPGNFFRVFAPINQVLGLLTLILFWRRSPQVRLYFGLAFLLFVIADALTFAYFYPRNAILFLNTPMADTETLRKTWAEWCSMNWVRTLIAAAGVAFACMGVGRVCRGKQ